MATVRPFCIVSGFIATNSCRSYEYIFVIEVGREYAYVLCGGYYVQGMETMRDS